MGREHTTDRSPSTPKGYMTELWKVFLKRTAADWRNFFLAIAAILVVVVLAGRAFNFGLLEASLATLLVALAWEVSTLGFHVWKQERQRSLDHAMQAMRLEERLAKSVPTDMELLMERLEQERPEVLDGMNGLEFLCKAAPLLKADPAPEIPDLLRFASPRQLIYTKWLPGHPEFARFVHGLVDDELLGKEPGPRQQFRLTQRGRNILALIDRRKQLTGG